MHCGPRQQQHHLVCQMFNILRRPVALIFEWRNPKTLARFGSGLDKPRIWFSKVVYSKGGTFFNHFLIDFGVLILYSDILCICSNICACTINKYIYIYKSVCVYVFMFDACLYVWRQPTGPAEFVPARVQSESRSDLKIRVFCWRVFAVMYHYTKWWRKGMALKNIRHILSWRGLVQILRVWGSL